MFYFLPLWLQYLARFVYRRPLEPEDYIFPAIGANGVVQSLLCISADTVQHILDEFTTKSGVAATVRGHFSTHCLRRGGAQYRFILAEVEDRWDLGRTYWWGGWSEGERVSGCSSLWYLVSDVNGLSVIHSVSTCLTRSISARPVMRTHYVPSNRRPRTVSAMHASCLRACSVTVFSHCNARSVPRLRTQSQRSWQDIRRHCLCRHRRRPSHPSRHRMNLLRPPLTAEELSSHPSLPRTTSPLCPAIPSQSLPLLLHIMGLPTPTLVVECRQPGPLPYLHTLSYRQ